MSSRQLAVTLAVASAFSSFPSPFYHALAGRLGGASGITAVLFASHGAAAIVVMSILSLDPVARRLARVQPRSLITILLCADAVAGLFLVFAAGPLEFGLLLTGRILTGAALGALTPLITAGLAGRRHGSALATAGILGGVGLGSLCAGGLAASGLGRPLVFAVGCAALLAVAIVGSRGRPESGSASAGSALAADGVRAGLGLALGTSALAFAANGVLGLFTSVLPSVVARDSGRSATFIAGATVGIVLLSAGGARLLLLARETLPTRVPAVVSLALGIVCFWWGVAVGSVWLSLLGGLLLGAAAGIGYDTAIGLVSSHATGGARVRALAIVQRSGQFGLVLPVLLYPLAIRH
ncbi:MAG TPA: hypothetical protein VGC18_09140 [Lacisediminihabitans sp.]|uniref:hypothetical protein n=1 Tax=Lacisediminihabitans sp. TaxID=2787631 RepID=UPI002EDB5784